MPNPRPEIIFLTGPQADEKAVIMGDAALVGRDTLADIVLLEDHASRRQMRFELIDQGWVVENLSANGTRVNGKRYKSGRKILLATGDVLGVGLDTEILFVAPGDDPDEAMRKFQGSFLADAAMPPKKSDEPATPASESPSDPATAPLPETNQADQPLETQRRKAKLKKYAIGFGIYAASIIALIVVLVASRDRQEPVSTGDLVRLKDWEISEVLTARMKKSPNSIVSAEALTEALRLYEDRKLRRGNLYKCVQSFKRHLAYKRVAGFDNPEHERMYHRALDELVGVVTEKYRNACNRQEQKNWRRAAQDFQDLLEVIPEPGSLLFQNVVDRLERVRREMRNRR
ncbi:MAG: FHA domain-containing protein [Planctomycetota bacterium]|nr:FHA domain-containing protein [Planctomycetota bacterium]